MSHRSTDRASWNKSHFEYIITSSKNETSRCCLEFCSNILYGSHCVAGVVIAQMVHAIRCLYAGFEHPPAEFVCLCVWQRQTCPGDIRYTAGVGLCSKNQQMHDQAFCASAMLALRILGPTFALSHPSSMCKFLPSIQTFFRLPICLNLVLHHSTQKRLCSSQSWRSVYI